MARSPDSDFFGALPLPVSGVRLASAPAGLRYAGRDDVALIELCEGAVSSGVFTQNRFAAAPVVVAREHLAKRAPRYLLINAGVANAGLGDPGIAATRRCCDALAGLAAIPAEAVLPFSTGVIGEALPAAKIVAVLPGLLAGLSADAWLDTARAMMTTDTAPKSEGVSCVCGDAASPVTITGVAKGAGMIHPDMATMLAFVATDIELNSAEADSLLVEAAGCSFHSVTVDGDTSTNDACTLSATGRSGVRFSALDAAGRAAFGEALSRVMQGLAKSLVRDAEGASRFITIEVEGAADRRDARTVAMTVANSPLVKTALSAGDPNWGRILAAIGRAPANVDIARVDFYFGDCRVVASGAVDRDYREEKGNAALAGREIALRIVLGVGNASTRVWTSDLTADYVRINADYRS